jgi:hypothetical protein
MPIDHAPGETVRGEAMREGARLGLILPRLCAYRGCIFSSYFSIPFDPTVEVDGSNWVLLSGGRLRGFPGYLEITSSPYVFIEDVYLN